MDSKLSDLGSERAVLAGLFAYGLESYVEISDFITHNSFAHRNNQVIYKCIEKVLGNEASIDLPAILSAAEQLSLSEIVHTEQELSYIDDLMNYPVKQDNVPHFAAQVKKFEIARKAKKIANKIGKDIDDINGDESIDDIVNPFFLLIEIF